MEWIYATIDGYTHRIAKPVADELKISDGSLHDDVQLLDKVICMQRQLIQARQDQLAAEMRNLGLASVPTFARCATRD